MNTQEVKVVSDAVESNKGKLTQAGCIVELMESAVIDPDRETLYHFNDGSSLFIITGVPPQFERLVVEKGDQADRVVELVESAVSSPQDHGTVYRFPDGSSLIVTGEVPPHFSAYLPIEEGVAETPTVKSENTNKGKLNQVCLADCVEVLLKSAVRCPTPWRQRGTPLTGTAYKFQDGSHLVITTEESPNFHVFLPGR